MSNDKTLKQSIEELKTAIDRNLALRKELKEITDKCMKTINDINNLEKIKKDK